MRKKSKKRLASPAGTRSIERSYARFLRIYQRDYEKLMKQEFEKIIPILKSNAKASSVENVRVDSSTGDLINMAIKKALAKLEKLHSKKKIKKWVEAMSGRVNKTTTETLSTQLRQHDNIDATIRADGKNKVVEKFVDFISINRQISDFHVEAIENNISLIQSISITGHDALKSGLLNAVLQNSTVADIRKILQSKLNVSKSRANLIARDQVGKFNSAVNQAKQRGLGVVKYIWRTSGDGRVRTRHQKLNGKEFSWEKPPSSGTKGEKLHPGEDIQCRCYAEPILEDLLT